MMRRTLVKLWVICLLQKFVVIMIYDSRMLLHPRDNVVLSRVGFMVWFVTMAVA